jgi:beta-galactosidase
MFEKEVLIGSELFINDHDEPLQVRNWVRQMHESKLKIIRLFVLWNQVQPLENEWNFANYDAVFLEAALCGMQVIPTFMSVNPPRWMASYGLYGWQGDLDNPEYLKYATQYIETVTKRYYTSAALHSWILWNEPTRIIEPGPYSIVAFDKYIHEKYKDNQNKIIELKRSLNFENEEGALAGDVYAAKGFSSTIEWTWFTVYNMEQQLRQIMDTVKQLDAKHPVHVNPHMTGYNHMKAGQSPWMEGRVVDFMGSSAHPVWHSTRFLPERVHQSVAYFADLMKSCTKAANKYFWVTEMQGGPTIVSGSYPSSPSKSDIKHWMWEAISAGTKGIVFWCFNSRDEGSEAGEWALLNQAGKPSKRLKVVTEICEILERYKGDFEGAQPRKEDAYILYSETAMSIAWSQADGDWSSIRGDSIDEPRNKNHVLDAVVGSYLMCADLGLEVQFVDETRILEENLDTTIPLIIPNVFAGDNTVWKAVETFVKEGGYVITDGLTAMKTPEGDINRGIKPFIDQLFGTLEDIEGYKDEFVLGHNENKKECIGWHFKCTFEETENNHVLLRDEEQEPVVIKTTYGRGKTLRIGTVFFQRYLSHPMESQLELLKEWSGITSRACVTLTQGTYDFRLRSLQTDEGELIILMNRGDTRVAELQSNVRGKLYDLDNHLISTLSPNECITIPIENDGVLVFKVVVDRMELPN